MDIKRDVNRDQVKQGRTHILLGLNFVQWEEFEADAEDLSLFQHFAANFQYVDHMLGLLVSHHETRVPSSMLFTLQSGRQKRLLKQPCEEMWPHNHARVKIKQSYFGPPVVSSKCFKSLFK